MARRNKAEMEAARVLEDKIVSCLRREDETGMHAVGRALVHLLNRQTREERNIMDTVEHNERGFASCDALIGQSHAEYYTRTGKLTLDQTRYWQRKPIKNGNGKRIAWGVQSNRITKYRRQLAEEAQLKAERKALA
jgi:hypothetical protein